MKQKDNEILLYYSKRLKQAKDSFVVRVGKDIPGHYVENLRDFKNTTGAEYTKKIKSK